MEKPLHIVVTHTHWQAADLFEQAVESARLGRPPMKATLRVLRLETRDRVTEWIPAPVLVDVVRGREVCAWEAVEGVRLAPEVVRYLETGMLVRTG